MPAQAWCEIHSSCPPFPPRPCTHGRGIQGGRLMKQFLKILCLTSAAWVAVICPVLSKSLFTSSKQLRQLSGMALK